MAVSPKNIHWMSRIWGGLSQCFYQHREGSPENGQAGGWESENPQYLQTILSVAGLTLFTSLIMPGDGVSSLFQAAEVGHHVVKPSVGYCLDRLHFAITSGDDLLQVAVTLGQHVR